MTGGKVTSSRYATGSPSVAMPWVHRTNSSRSPVSPGVGRRSARTAAATRKPRPRTAKWPRVQAPAGVIGPSDPLGGPVPLGEAVDPSQLGDLAGVRAHRVGHLAFRREQPADLALVQPDARALALQPVADVGVLRAEPHVRRECRRRV